MEIDSMTIPRANRTGAGGIELRFPYNAGLVELLKSEIPAYARSYDPDDKTWTVTSAYAARAVDLLLKHFPDARIERPGARLGSTPQHSIARPFAVLHLLPSAPPELVDAAYRTLAKLAHPDRGGSHEHMVQLTAAHDAVKALVTS
jgi:hypothetical protein